MPPEQEDRERKEIGRRIKTIRQSRGMTGQQLSKQAGISPGYLSEVERGLSAISFEKLVRVAEELAVSVSVFREEGESPTDNEKTVRIPTALSNAAEQLGLSYRSTLRLLEGKQSLVARRSSAAEHEWSVDDWMKFHKRVKDYLTDH